VARRSEPLCTGQRQGVTSTPSRQHGAVWFYVGVSILSILSSVWCTVLLLLANVEMLEALGFRGAPGCSSNNNEKLFVCMGVFVCLCVSVCLCMGMCVWMFVCMGVCVWVCVCV